MPRFSPCLGDVEGLAGHAPGTAQHGPLSPARCRRVATGHPAGEQPNPAATVDLGRIRRAMLVVICLSGNCADDESAVPLARFDRPGGVRLRSGQTGLA